MVSVAGTQWAAVGVSDAGDVSLPEISYRSIRASLKAMGDIGATRTAGTRAYTGIKLSIYHTLMQQTGSGITLFGGIGLRGGLGIDLNSFNRTHRKPWHGPARTVPT